MDESGKSAQREQAERFEVVAIAASAGGVVALRDVLAALPANLSVPVLVVQHLDRRHQTVIAEVIGRLAELKVKVARTTSYRRGRNCPDRWTRERSIGLRWVFAPDRLHPRANGNGLTIGPVPASRWKS